MASPASNGSQGGNPMYMLQWHEHHASFFRLMEDLCREQSLTDVTITCGDVSLEAHSLILGASSPILRSILAKGEGKKQTLHFMDMNPYHMQLLLQYMYRGEISVPQVDLAPLMASARSLQIKGLCTANPNNEVNNGSLLPPQVPVSVAPPNSLPPQTDRLSEFANYLAANTQPQPITSTNLIMPPGDLQPLDASGLINLEPPQQPVMMVNSSGKKPNKRGSSKNQTELMLNNGNKALPSHGGPTAAKKRKTKKPFEDLRRPNLNSASSLMAEQANHNGSEQNVMATPDTSSNIKHLGEVHDDDLNETVDGNGVGGITENWSDQQTIKVKGHRIPVLPKPLSQMKTTETRSYLSRLIWATNGWKRPQYGNPETKPVWWPNELLNWAEMKKMGGKKADGLSNVNYNEIQKTILHEGYKYFGFDPETLCHIKTGSPSSANEEPIGLHGTGHHDHSGIMIKSEQDGVSTSIPLSTSDSNAAAAIAAAVLANATSSSQSAN